MLSQFTEHLEELRAVRRDIHAHPETAFEELRTSNIVANYLREVGVDEVHEKIGKVGKLGIVGIINGKLSGKNKGKSIAFRADMDALPMTEIAPEDRKHASTVTNRFHGCGHDGHTTMLLGAAKYLAQNRDFSGRVVLIFQPAEENLSGAKDMLEDGLLTRFPFDEVYGLHNYPSLEKGRFFVNEHATLSANDSFVIAIKGKGSHGATPQMSIDPIVMAARVVMDFQTIISRNIAPSETAVLSLGEIHGGSANNVIPESVRLTGTVRTYNESVRAKIKARMKILLDSIAQGFEGEITLHFISGCPALINDFSLATETVLGLHTLLGEKAATLCKAPQSPSEDFSFYLEEVKGVYSFLGQGDTPMCHHPSYDFDDTLIPLGIAYWVSLVKNRLG